jgi:hypothetical protein
LDEESLVSIFRLCSQFAKKSPWWYPPHKNQKAPE